MSSYDGHFSRTLYRSRPLSVYQTRAQRTPYRDSMYYMGTNNNLALKYCMRAGDHKQRKLMPTVRVTVVGNHTFSDKKISCIQSVSLSKYAYIHVCIQQFQSNLLMDFKTMEFTFRVMF